MMAAGATGLCGRIYAFASDFWNKKAPADWSSEEVHQLLNKSPWAKEVTAGVAARSSSNNSGGGNNSGMGGNSRNMGGGGTGGGSRGGMGGGGGVGGMGGGGGMGSSGGAPRTAQQFKGIVRWESAAPIQEAGKTKLSDDFANHYVISVIGFPFGGRRSDSADGTQPTVSKSALERIKAASSLTPKGKDAVQAGAAQVIGDALLLGFSKESLKLSADDKEVAFATALGRLAIKTKFTFKEMMYHEALAV